MEDIAEYLRLAGGGRLGTCLIAPNSPTHYGKVMARLMRVQSNRFFQVRSKRRWTPWYMRWESGSRILFGALSLLGPTLIDCFSPSLVL